MKRLGLIIFSIFFLTTISWASDVVYRVKIAHGTGMVQRGDSPDQYEKLDVALDIFGNDKIILTGSGNYFVLVGESGRMKEIRSAGVYHIKDFLLAQKGESPFLAPHYVSSFWNRFELEKDSSNLLSSYINSTERSSYSEKISLSLPDASLISNEDFTFWWESEEKANSYRIEVRDQFGEIVYTHQTTTKKATISRANMGLKPAQIYEIRVVESNNPYHASKSVTLTVPAPSELGRFETETELLRAEVNGSIELENAVMGAYYEENGLMINALSAYKSASEAAPSIPEYEMLFDLFLYRLNISFWETNS